MIHGLKMLTEAQRKARNGKVQRTTFGPLALCVEIPAGWRKGASFLTAHYGYISGTKAPDGAAIDMFLSPQASVMADVFVIDHMKGNKFDEPKVFLGFTSKVDAEETYRNVYAQRAPATKMTMTQFQQWMKEGGAMQPTIKEEPKLQKVYWDSNGDPDVPMTEILYQIRKTDPTSLALEPLTLDDIYGDADEVVELDALVVPMMRLERVATIMQNQMKRYGSEALNFQVSKPFKKNGTAQVAVVYELADGQTISIYFHSPDVTPSKIAPQDELISWKWMLNKKDITILVAPEKGQDLDPREVMRRVAKIAIKNRPTFERNNNARVERVKRVEALKSEIVVLEKEVEDKTHTLEILHMKIEEKRNMQPEPEVTPEPTPEEEAVPSLADELTEKIANLNSLMDVRDLQAAIRNPELSRKDKKRLKDALEARVDAINSERAERKANLFEEFGKQIAAIETEADANQVESAIASVGSFTDEEASGLYAAIAEKRAKIKQKEGEEAARKAAEQAKQAELAPGEPKPETLEERVTRLHDAVIALINSATSIEDIRALKKSATFKEFRFMTEGRGREDMESQRESIRTALYAKSAELNAPLYNEIMGEIQAATDESGVLAALEKVELVRNDFPPSQRNEITQAAEARIEAMKAKPEPAPQESPLPEVPVVPPTHEEPAPEPVAEQPSEAVNATPLNEPVNPQEEADRSYLKNFDPATADDARLEEIASRYTSGEMLELLEKALSKYEEYMVSAAEESMK